MISKFGLVHVLRQMLSGLPVTIEAIQTVAGSLHGKAWMQGKQERIQALPPLNQSNKAQQMALLSVVNLVFIGPKQLPQLEKNMEELAMMLSEVRLLKTIPGVRDKLAAVLAEEIGDASQFETPK